MAQVVVNRIESLNDFREKFNLLSSLFGDVTQLDGDLPADIVEAINFIKNSDVVLNGEKTFSGFATFEDSVDIDGDLNLNVGEFTVKDSIAGNTTLSVDAQTGDLTHSGQLVTDGDATFNSNVNVAGNLTVDGTLTTVNSETINLQDPVITLGHVDGGLTSDDGKSRGIEFKYFEGGSEKTGFFGFNNATGEFTYIVDATNTGEVFTGTLGTLNANLEWSNILDKPDPEITVTLTGHLLGSGSVTLTDLLDGTINIATTVADDSVELGTKTTGDYVERLNQSTGVFITNPAGESSQPTISIGQDVSPGQSVSFDGLTVNPSNPISAKIDRTNVNGIENYLDMNSATTQVVNSNVEVSAGSTMTVLGTLDVSDGNLQVGSGAGSLNINTTFIELGDDSTIDPQNPENGGITLNRGAGNTSADVTWNENAGEWQTRGLDDSGQSIISDILTKYNVKDIFSGSYPGLTVTYNTTSKELSINPDEFTITVTGDVAGSTTITDLGDATLDLQVQPDSVELGTHTTGNYVKTVTGGSGITATGSGEGASKVISVDNSVVRTTGNQTIGGNKTFQDDITINGDLTVAGDLITVNSEVVEIADNILLLNSNVTGTPSENGGIEIERGTSDNVSIIWNETTDKWTLTEDGSVFHNILTTNDDDEVIKFVDGDGTLVSTSPNQSLKFGEGAGIDVNFTDATGPEYVLTVTNTDRGSSQNIFKNIAVSGQSTVIADSNNDTLTFAGGSGIDITTNASTDTLTVSHTDTSTVSNISVDNSGGTVIQDVSLEFDNFGHVTSRTITSVNLDDRYFTETEADARFLGINAKADDANLLDGLNSTQFVRSDVDDTRTGYLIQTDQYIRLDDNVDLRLGTGSDFRMDFDGSNTVFRSYSHGSSWLLQGENTSGTNRNLIIADPDTSVELYYAGNPVAETTSTGIAAGLFTGDLTGNAGSATVLETARTISLSGDLSGSASFNGSSDISINAVVANDSHTHVSSNITDFSEAVQDVAGGMFSGNTEAGISVTYNDTSGKINLDVNDFTITMGGVITGNGTVSNLGNTSITTGFASGAVIDKAKQWETARTITLDGDVTGSVSINGTSDVTLNATVNSATNADFATNADTVDGVHASSFIRNDAASDVNTHVRWQDDWIASWGDSQDMKLYHSTNNYINVNQDLLITHGTGPGTETLARFNDDSSVQLYFNNSKKFETSSAGATVTGDLTVTGTLLETSDIDVKEEIEIIPDAVAKVKAINGVTFVRSDLDDGIRRAGVIAQEVEEVLPEVVHEDPDGNKKVAYGNMVGLLIEAIKEQQGTINKLTSRINKLEKQQHNG